MRAALPSSSSSSSADFEDDSPGNFVLTAIAAADDARMFCNKRNGEMDISGDALIFPDFFLAANRLFLLPSKLDSLLFRKDVERERDSVRAGNEEWRERKERGHDNNNVL
jgi:hypothetical protein